MALVIDLDTCMGCQACALVCKTENNIELGSFWSSVLGVGPDGRFPDVQMYFLPVQCQQCEDPPCVEACPTEASYKREDGIVVVDENRCIGCQYCVLACPYGVRSYNQEAGVVEKCMLCVHLVDAGEQPACVRVCQARARLFGDLDDPESEVSRKIREAEGAVHRLADAGNRPSVAYILHRQEWRSI